MPARETGQKEPRLRFRDSQDGANEESRQPVDTSGKSGAFRSVRGHPWFGGETSARPSRRVSRFLHPLPRRNAQRVAGPSGLAAGGEGRVRGIGTPVERSPPSPFPLPPKGGEGAEEPHGGSGGHRSPGTFGRFRVASARFLLESGKRAFGRFVLPRTGLASGSLTVPTPSGRRQPRPVPRLLRCGLHRVFSIPDIDTATVSGAMA
jgi:hypothetical protein